MTESIKDNINYPTDELSLLGIKEGKEIIEIFKQIHSCLFDLYFKEYDINECNKLHEMIEQLERRLNDRTISYSTRQAT